MGIKFLAVAGTAMVSVATPSIGQDMIKIGATGALSGPAASLGKDALAGLELAVEEINARGGVKGKKIDLIFRDDEAKPPNAVNLARQLVQRDGVTVFFPSTNTTPNLATLQVTTPAGVPHVIAGTTSDIVCPLPGGDKPCEKNVVRLSITNTWQAAAISKFIKEKLKTDKVALLYDSTEYGQDGQKLLLKALKDQGITPLYQGTFELGERNFKPHLSKAREAGAGVLVTWTLDFVVAQIAIQKRELGYNEARIIGPNALTGTALRNLAQNAAEGIFVSDGMPSSVQSSDPAVQELMKRYQEKYKVEAKWGVPYFTMTYYDGMQLVAKKLEQVGADRNKLNEALASAGTFKGVSVAYDLQPDKRNARDGATAVSILEIRDGRLVNPD